ncbi:uncharacterized protein TNCV_3546641 [Trichonephila clavipes]|nr:uncharacterized protein TNCV_3546641 [Trichonephila clavipes]
MKHCGNCDVLFKAKGVECLVQVVCSSVTMLVHIRLDAQQLFSRNSAGGCLILPPYNSDLASSDFHAFLYLKKFLFSGERFGNNEEMKTSVTSWFHSLVGEFYDSVIQKLMPRFDKCLNSGGGYVGK